MERVPGRNPSGCGLAHLYVALLHRGLAEFLIAGEQIALMVLRRVGYVGGPRSGGCRVARNRGERGAVRCPSGRKCSQIVEGRRAAGR